MSREQKPLTVRINISPLLDTVKVLDHLRKGDDEDISYTMIIEELLEESHTFRKIKELQTALENHKILRELAKQSTENDVLSSFTKQLELKERF